MKKINNFPIKLKTKYERPSMPTRTIIGRSCFAELRKCSMVANGVLPTRADEDI